MNTKAGGQKVRETIIRKYGKDFYTQIGAKGGRNGNTGGFACKKIDDKGRTGRDRASIYGAIGGRISRRGKREDA